MSRVPSPDSYLFYSTSVVVGASGNATVTAQVACAAVYAVFLDGEAVASYQDTEHDQGCAVVCVMESMVWGRLARVRVSVPTCALISIAPPPLHSSFAPPPSSTQAQLQQDNCAAHYRCPRPP